MIHKIIRRDYQSMYNRAYINNDYGPHDDEDEGILIVVERKKLKERGPQCKTWKKYMVYIQVFIIFILI